MKNKPLPSLVFCILMDIIGYASFSIPVIGEVSDIIWAPISALIFARTFGGRLGTLGSVFNFIEEFLPFLDFIPSFSIAWFIQSRISQKSEAELPAVANRIRY
ncbi:MAG TPA: hypothetical protein VK498_15500 [Ferruginibacter sp.]|nr:hypothetical protein [Ferruginibacter sp.]